MQNTSHQQHPRTSTTPENIAAVRDLIEGDRRLTVVEICQELGISYGSMQSIIKNELQFRKISARWVPRLLSDQKKALTEEKLAQLYWTALQHPPHSPDLSPCDYHMFGPLNARSAGGGSLPESANGSQIDRRVLYRVLIISC